MKIGAMRDEDIESVLAIQSECPEAAQWTAWDYARVTRGEMAGWVAEEAGIVGFVAARRIGDDLEILNLAVTADARRAGVGTALLSEVLAWGLQFAAEKAFLEVRASNNVALQFYERSGFRAAGRRSRYYVAPIDDALLLTLVLRPEREK